VISWLVVSLGREVVKNLSAGRRDVKPCLSARHDVKTCPPTGVVKNEKSGGFEVVS